ncbi:MAG: D-alanyl-D-alanine carboxypeptidase family protein [Candidatus Daviesbacteria bacterium]|nr:D-alanyl-D-alanine carboxypeptidase family protein [Candidatus Daviesbacteria bacterium]
MKKYLILAILLIIFDSLLIFDTIHKFNSELASPLTKRGKILGTNIWIPNMNLVVQASDMEINAKGVLFIDSINGKVFFSKNPHQKLPIASLVKVMTVLVALEYKDWEDEYLVSDGAAGMEPDKMLLIPGEKLTLEELLYGIFLISANDAAEVIAEGTLRPIRMTQGKQAQGKQGDREEFIQLMNAKAKQLGMQNTYFVNPTGLDEDSGNSYSTAYDLAVLTRYLVKNYPEVVEISQTEHIILPATATHQDYDMYSGINLLTTYPGVVGFKTGYTPEAGLTLITLARKNGQEVLGVLLGSENRREEAKELLDYSFKKLGS